MFICIQLRIEIGRYQLAHYFMFPLTRICLPEMIHLFVPIDELLCKYFRIVVMCVYMHILCIHFRGYVCAKSKINTLA